MMNPKTNSEEDEISLSMIIGPGKGIMGNLIKVATDRKPTIIMEYSS